ncbi:MAG: hypothetical protein E6J15_11180 [Chloroflexi bacterium]|nr:MAG: hypothetical protein E6J15_11180 [Chloroflexota bacterium]
MVRSIEGLYGPPRWTQDEWLGKRHIARPTRAPTPKQPLGSLVLRTLLAVAAASLCWYAVAGGAVFQSTVSFVLQATGLARQTSQLVTAEYLIAMRTLRVGEVLASADLRVSQLGTLLDEMSPKCTEDRFELAAALIGGHDALALRGIDEPAVSLLRRVNDALPDQTRQSRSTSCTEVINRLVATRIATR